MKRLLKAVAYLRREVDRELPAQQLLLFIAVGKQEGITQQELTLTLGMPNGSVSRNVKSMSQYMQRGVLKGHGLLESRPDLTNRQCQAVFLTSKGKRVLGELDLIMEAQDGNRND